MKKEQINDQKLDEVGGGYSIGKAAQRLVFMTYGMANAPQDCTCSRCKGTITAGEACYQSSASSSCIHNACYFAWEKELG